MPEGGPAEKAGLGDVGGPQQPQAYAPPPPTAMPAMPVDPNQSTTKPRQMPGDGGGGMSGSEQMDPAMNGSEGGPAAFDADQPAGDDVAPMSNNGAPRNDPPGAEGQSPKPPVPSIVSRRAVVTRIAAMMRTVQQENPDVGEHESFLLAKAALERFPVIADMHGLDFGNRSSHPKPRWPVDPRGVAKKPSHQPRHADPSQPMSTRWVKQPRPEDAKPNSVPLPVEPQDVEPQDADPPPPPARQRSYDPPPPPRF